MAQVYSKRLLASDNVLGAITATVPTGVVWIVRDMDALIDGTLGGAALYVAWDNGVIAPTFWYIQNSGGPELFEWRGRLVLEEGDVIVATQSGTGLTQLTISGYELTLP